MIATKSTKNKKVQSMFCGSSKNPAYANRLLDAALEYARRGWAVLPLHTAHNASCSCGKPACEEIGKHPRFHLGDLQHGLLNATTNEALVSKWWARWSDANIAIATGTISGFIVLDIDVAPEYDGNATLKALEAQHGRLPDTVQSLRGGGGRHILFADAGLVLRNNTELAAGLHIKANGGYIVAPPSWHETGKEYQWEASYSPEDVPLAPIPVWLVKMIFEKTTDKNHVCAVYGK